MLLWELPAGLQAQLTYKDNRDGTATITGYTGTNSTVVIPAMTNGLQVTSIGEGAFQDCHSLTNVTIPDGVTSIGNYAFQDCLSLTSITIPNRVTSIGQMLFSGCSSLASVTLGTNLTHIDVQTFAFCTSLTSILIPASITGIGEGAFYSCSSLTSVFFTGNAPGCGLDIFAGDYNVKVYATLGTTGWANSGGYTFDGISVAMLGSPIIVTPPRSQTVLAGSTVELAVVACGAAPLVYQWFFNGNAMAEATNSILDFTDIQGSQAGAYTVVITNTYGSVTNSAATLMVQFEYTNSFGIWSYQINADRLTLTITGYSGPGGEVSIPNSINGLAVNAIGQAFCYCSNLTGVTIPDSVTSIGDGAFSNCLSLASIAIPTNVTNIGDYAFYQCPLLSDLAIGTGVTSIGWQAFAGCTNLTSVTIPNRVTSIGEYVFAGCTSLTNIMIPESVTGIFGIPGTFSGCTSLKSIAIPNTVTSIGEDTFSGCTSLTSVTIPNSVTNIGAWAFWYCIGLTSVTISTNLHNIGDYLFGACVSLTGVTIPGSVTNIGNYAFQSCTSLKSITFPNSVISIGNGAFWYCTNLTSITIPNSVTSIAENAFCYCTSLTNITIPDSVTGIWGTFSGCTSLKSITIPNRVTIIGEDTFAGCTSLTNITIPDSVTSIGQYAFGDCTSLKSITIPASVTSLGMDLFYSCTNLTHVFFTGNSPSCWAGFGVAPDLFEGDPNVTVYAVLGTSDWNSTFDGVTVVMVPGIGSPPQSQTAEIGDTVNFTPDVPGLPAVTCLWFLDGTNLIYSGTNDCLELTNAGYSLDGAYTLVVTNAYGAVTSSPAMLAVIPVVAHQPVPAIQVTGTAGSVLNVECVNSLAPALDWTTLGSVSLTNTSQFYFDTSMPLAPQRFYRVWQSGLTGVVPSLSVTGLVPMVTLTGTAGGSVELDYINRFGPTNAWVTLGRIMLTNTTQPYFDLSALGQPPRLYRITTVP